MDGDTLTTQQVTLLFEVNPMTVRRRCQTGSLKGAVKVGTGRHSVWLIPRQSVDTFERPRRGPKAE
jgi:hypothetical protein